MIDALKGFAIDHIRDGLEITVLSVLIYYGYRAFRNTRGARVLYAVAIALIALSLIANLLGLPVIGWVVNVLSAFLAITLVVIFQPELRRSLMEFRGHRLFKFSTKKQEFIEDLLETIHTLSHRRHGALIAIEREMDLNQYLENGVKLDSLFAHELLLTIFHPKTALHDGGMIMRDTRILGSACVFPVSQKELSDRSIGLRHRAGLGISEESDAIAIIVSEETGHISLCQNGNLEQDLEGEALKDRLNEMMGLSQKEEDPDDSNKSEEEAA